MFKNGVWKHPRFHEVRKSFIIKYDLKIHYIYIALFCFFEALKALYIVRGVSPHPPPVCSFHLDDAPAAIVRQNTNINILTTRKNVSVGM